MEGEEGVVAEKIDREFWREGLEKEGEVVGLQGEGGSDGEEVVEGSGGKSTSEEKEGTKGEGVGFRVVGVGRLSIGA